MTLTGKILLVGNMGLYDYRPYVKKITNDRQILFDCDKGFKLGIGTEILFYLRKCTRILMPRSASRSHVY